MSTVPLPDHPSLKHLRNQARKLQRDVRAGDPQASALVAAHHPEGAPAAPETLPLNAAQLVIARRHGFASWPALKRHLDVVERYSWDPDDDASSATEDLADRFCRLACLSYQDDGPERWAAARELLTEQPSLPGTGVWAAAAASDRDAVQRCLARDPGLASTRGGPFDSSPLFYLVYSRLDPSVEADAVLGAARLLLDAGADADEGYLWHGLPTPFTLLTGTFGHGELAPDRQPAHPHSIALARLLLEAGADPNDAQTLYNRMFEPGDEHLQLLFEYGLGTGDGGPWKRRLGDQLDSPAEMVRAQLDWAVAHDQFARVRLLVEHGVQIASRDGDGHTPAEVAALTGSTEIAEYLVGRGSPPVRLSGTDALAAAIMAGDREPVNAFGDGLLDELRARQPWLIVWAAARHRIDAVRILIDHGWNVNAYGRGDVPSGMEWQTALHQAAIDGDVTLIELLLGAGADPNLKDRRFDAIPLGWARHGNRPDAVEVLLPVTSSE